MNKLDVVLNDNALRNRHASRAIRFMVANYQEDLTLEHIALAVGTSRFNICKVFQRLHGVSPMKWLWNFRSLLASELIKKDPYVSLTDIAFSCGYSSSAHFSRNFRKTHGISPSEFKSKISIDASTFQKMLEVNFVSH